MKNKSFVVKDEAALKYLHQKIKKDLAVVYAAIGRDTDDENLESYWTVKYNSCKCHPETCACNEWALYRPNGAKHSTFFSKQDAEEIALLANEVVDLRKELAEKTALLQKYEKSPRKVKKNK